VENEMKVIGLLGGMSWESTADYYRIINREVRERLGGLHSAKIVMYSLDFGPVAGLQQKEDWQGLTALMADGAGILERGGADFFLICTNTMHKVSDDVERVVNIPLLHIVDATAAEIRKVGISTVGLLGTRFTMEDGFFHNRLSSGYGLEVVIPEESGRRAVHGIIYDELCRGEVRDSSREELGAVIEDLRADGAEGIILGCTELPILIGVGDSALPIFDTTRIHALGAVDLALGEGPAPGAAGRTP
jgi:aspartate racemase